MSVISKRDSIVLITTGLLMIISGTIFIFYEFPNINNIIYAFACIVPGAIFTLLGYDFYKVVKEKKK